MPYLRNRGNVNLILLTIIGLAVFALVAWLGYNAGLNASEGLSSLPPKSLETVKGTDVYLTSISLAENLNLAGSSGLATIDRAGGRVAVDVILPVGVSLPQGTILEAWLVDAGKNGGLGQSSVSEADQKYGTPFANTDFSVSVDSAPYAASLGALVWDEARGSWHLFYNAPGDLTPYDAVMITAESDNNIGNYDPRPGTPILIGKIEESK